MRLFASLVGLILGLLTSFVSGATTFEIDRAERLARMATVHAGSGINCLGTAFVGAGAIDVLIGQSPTDWTFKTGCFERVEVAVPGAVGFVRNNFQLWVDSLGQTRWGTPHAVLYLGHDRI